MINSITNALDYIFCCRPCKQSKSVTKINKTAHNRFASTEVVSMRKALRETPYENAKSQTLKQEG